MRKLTKKVSKMAGVAVATMVLSAAANAVSAETLRIMTASPGGVWYSLGARYAQLLEQNIEGLTVTSSQGGSVPNARKTNEDKNVIGVIYADFAQRAMAGVDPFKDKLENVRILATIAPGKLQIAVPKDSDVKQLSDLKNKRINPTKIGWGTRDIAEMVLKEGAGVTFDSIQKNGGKVFSVGHDDGMNMMVDKQLDALFFLGGSASTILSLSTNPGVRLIPIEGEAQKKILESDENKDKIFFADTITSDMYDFLKQPVPTVSVMQVFIANKDMPDELAYKMTKLIYEKSEDLKKLFPGQADESFRAKDAANIQLPFHPGAKKYLSEQGVSVS